MYITVCCARCGVELLTAEKRSPTGLSIRLVKCEVCLSEAHNKGYETGYANGYDAGSRDARIQLRYNAP